MNDLDRQADLTNPDVLKALEIAKVEWEESELGEKYDPKFSLVIDAPNKSDPIEVFTQFHGFPRSFRRKATPADLDHSLVYWLFTWLPEHGGSHALLDDLATYYKTPGWPLLRVAQEICNAWIEQMRQKYKLVFRDFYDKTLAQQVDVVRALVAKAEAVVKVGQPEGEETDDG